VLAVDAGDIFQGTAFYKLYHGEVEVNLLNKAGYDIYTIGNHEFDDGPDNLAKQLKSARFDIISANLDASAVPELAGLVKRSVIKRVCGRDVAFVGAITPDLEQVSLNLKGVKVIKGQASVADRSWIEPIREEVRRLAAQGIERIILVTHCGLERDRLLAESIPEVDAIVGGHSHTRLGRAQVVAHRDGSSTVIVQTGCYSRALGELKLAFDCRGLLILPELDYHLIEITDRIPEEPEMKAYIAEKGRPLLALKNQVAGIALGDFDNRFSLYPWDSPIGDLVCDALAEAGSKYGATIAFQNRGGIRGRIDRGLVSMEKVGEVLPFDNHLVLATVQGSAILGALEHSVSGKLGAQFLDVHGLKVSYDPSRQPGKRILSVLAIDHRGRWHKIKPAANYRIAINDYTFSGGEGYNFAGARDVQSTDQTVAHLLAVYLERHRKVRPQPHTRIQPVHAR